MACDPPRPVDEHIITYSLIEVEVDGINLIVSKFG